MVGERLHIDGLDEQLPDDILESIQSSVYKELMDRGRHNEDLSISWEEPVYEDEEGPFKCPECGTVGDHEHPTYMVKKCSECGYIGGQGLFEEQ